MISVIIPVYNEASILAQTLKRFEGLDQYQLIFSDGGSTDDTCSLIPTQFIRVESKKGRATQMNAAVSSAAHELLLFLHADSQIEKEALIQLEAQYTLSGYDLACMSLKFDEAHPLLNLIATLSNKRVDVFKISFGDQGLLIPKAIFQEAGGFKDLPIMEDLEFSLRLKKTYRLGRLNAYVTTSARRFKKKGIIRTMLQMHLLKLMYFMRVNPQKIHHLYQDIR